LEASLSPTTQSGIDRKRRLIAIKGEAVYAFPAKLEDGNWEAHACKLCADKTSRDKDVRLHMVFHPRGHMSPIYPTDTDYTEVRAWDVALSQALYARCPYPSGKVPEKALALYRAYADYYPDRYVDGGSGYKELKRKTMGRTKAIRPVPDSVRKARRF
jgi:hypothetical protein